MFRVPRRIGTIQEADQKISNNQQPLSLDLCFADFWVLPFISGLRSCPKTHLCSSFEDSKATGLYKFMSTILFLSRTSSRVCTSCFTTASSIQFVCSRMPICVTWVAMNNNCITSLGSSPFAVDHVHSFVGPTRGSFFQNRSTNLHQANDDHQVLNCHIVLVTGLYCKHHLKPYIKTQRLQTLQTPHANTKHTYLHIL